MLHSNNITELTSCLKFIAIESDFDDGQKKIIIGVRRQIELHHFRLNLWVFNVVTVCIKCKNCFERGRIWKFELFWNKRFQVFELFWNKMQMLQILPSLHKQHGPRNKSRFARFAEIWSLGGQERGSYKTHKHRYWATIYLEYTVRWKHEEGSSISMLIALNSMLIGCKWWKQEVP